MSAHPAKVSVYIIPALQAQALASHPGASLSAIVSDALRQYLGLCGARHRNVPYLVCTRPVDHKGKHEMTDPTDNLSTLAWG